MKDETTESCQNKIPNVIEVALVHMIWIQHYK